MKVLLRSEAARTLAIGVVGWSKLFGVFDRWTVCLVGAEVSG